MKVQTRPPSKLTLRRLWRTSWWVWTRSGLTSRTRRSFSTSPSSCQRICGRGVVAGARRPPLRRTREARRRDRGNRRRVCARSSKAPTMIRRLPARARHRARTNTNQVERLGHNANRRRTQPPLSTRASQPVTRAQPVVCYAEDCDLGRLDEVDDRVRIVSQDATSNVFEPGPGRRCQRMFADSLDSALHEDRQAWCSNKRSFGIPIDGGLILCKRCRVEPLGFHGRREVIERRTPASASSPSINSTAPSWTSRAR